MQCNCVFLSACSILSYSFMTPWTVVLQALLLMGFPRQEYKSGLPFPSPGDLPDPEIKLASLCVSHVGRQILYHCAIWETHSTIEMGPNPLWYLHPEILRSKRNILRMKLQQKKKKRKWNFRAAWEWRGPSPFPISVLPSAAPFH